MPEGPSLTAPPLRAAVGRAQPRMRMPRVILALVLREIATRYGRSPGGYLWEIAEPVAGIALLSTVFSLTFALPAIGTNFAIFYASGFLPFTLYQDIQSTVARSIPFSRPFLQYPCVTFMDAIIARLILNFLTQVTVFIIILSGINYIYGLNIDWDLPILVKAILLLTLFGAGVGVLNCYLFMEFPVWERAWSILTRPLFLISGLLFTYGAMPKALQNVLWYNPLIHGVGMMRAGIYRTYDASYVSPLYVVGVSMVLIFFGLMLLYRHHSRLLER